MHLHSSYSSKPEIEHQTGSRDLELILKLTFALVGLIHLLTLPLLDNFKLIKDSKLLLRYSKTSDLLRRILDNWQNRLYYYIFNMVITSGVTSGFILILIGCSVEYINFLSKL